jgi:S1-C subfamily serine protease
MRDAIRDLLMIGLLASAGLTAAPSPVVADDISVQEALLRAKPAVALVVAEVAAEVTVRCGAGSEVRVSPRPFRETGTGWFVSPDGWLITNAHVVSAAHEPPKWLATEQARKGVSSACLPAQLARRGLKPGERPDVEEEIVRRELGSALKTAQAKLDPSISVILSNGLRLSAKVAKYSPPVAGEAMSGRDLALLRLEASDVPTLSLAASDNSRIGDPIHIIGFPGVVLSHELLNASARVEASVTTGAISGFQQDLANEPVIQTDAPAAWGNSGGPAVNSRGEVVGVLTFVSLDASNQGAIVQGFNFVIPVAAIKEFLKGTDVALGAPSRFDAAWRGALRAFFTADHARAEKLIAEANRLLPELPDVRRTAAENRERLQHPPPKPFPWALVAGVVTTVSAGAYGVMWSARWKRNRYRIRPGDVVRLIESPTPPIILDVRDSATYAKSPVRIPNAHHVASAELQSGVSALKIEPERTVVAYCT